MRGFFIKKIVLAFKGFFACEWGMPQSERPLEKESYSVEVLLRRVQKSSLFAGVDPAFLSDFAKQVLISDRRVLAAFCEGVQETHEALGNL